MPPRHTHRRIATTIPEALERIRAGLDAFYYCALCGCVPVTITGWGIEVKSLVVIPV